MKNKKCDLCGGIAKVFLTQILQHKKKAMALCEEHAKAFDLASLQTYDIIPGTNLQDRTEGLRCMNCGLTEALFRKRGRCGCHCCYEHLRPLIQPHLQHLHTGVRHVGKFPHGRMDAEILHRRLNHLKRQLEQAVAAERYEDAASYRDAISSIEIL
jgi:protein arginine kinase activator